MKYYIIRDPYKVERRGIKTWRLQTISVKELDFMSDLFLDESGKKIVRRGLVKEKLTNVGRPIKGLRVLL